MSKDGAHAAHGSRNGYGLFCEAKPAVVLSVNDGGALQEAKTKSGGHTFTIFRDTTVYLDAPNGIDQATPAQARAMADNYYPQLKAKWLLNEADYYTVLNEPAGNDAGVMPSYLAYEQRMMELAEVDGWRLCILNLASGTPDDGRVGGGESTGGIETWKSVYVPHIRRALEGGHIYGRHAYDENGIDRALQEAAYLLEQGLAGGMVITELGWQGGYGYLGDAEFVRRAKAVDTQMRSRANIIGGCLWTLGDWPNKSQSANWQTATDEMAAYLKANPTPKWTPPELPDEPDPEPWREKVRQAAEEAAPTNDDAALQRWILAQPGGWKPYGPEVWQEVGETVYAAQAAIDWETPAEARPRRTAYCVVPNWAEVDWLEDSGQLAIANITDDLPTGGTYLKRSLGEIETLVVHHTDTPTTTTPQQIADFHVDTREWPGIGYHYLIGVDGTTYQTNELATVSYHVGPANSRCVGIGLIGDFTLAHPTPAQLASARLLIRHLQSILPTDRNVLPHLLVSATQCPGNTWQEWWEWTELPSGTFEFAAWPTEYRVVTQTFANNPAYYGQFNLPGHEGVDIRAYAGTPIYAVADGVVVEVDNVDNSAYGRYVELEHADGYRILYAHCSWVSATLGQRVAAGQQIATAGSTGNSTAAHLHLTMYRPGHTYVDANGTRWPLSIHDPTPYLLPFNPTWLTSPPATGIDLLPYLIGDGRSYELQYTWDGGGTHPVQCHRDGNRFYIVKGDNGEYEALSYDDRFIYRAEDTSEAHDKFYVQYTKHPDGTLTPGAPWINRHVAVGQEMTFSPYVIHYWQHDCSERGPKGQPVNQIKVIAHHDSYTFPSGITLSNVIELGWPGQETYFFAKDFSLVGWRGEGVGESYISEIHQNRPLTRNVPPCL